MATSSRSPCLPLSRVKTIMKSSPDSFNIGQDALVMVAKAAELMIGYLATETLNNSSDPKYLGYKDLAELVNSEERLEFLRDIIPAKIKLKDYMKILDKVEEKERKNMEI